MQRSRSPSASVNGHSCGDLAGPGVALPRSTETYGGVSCLTASRVTSAGPTISGRRGAITGTCNAVDIRVERRGRTILRVATSRQGGRRCSTVAPTGPLMLVVRRARGSPNELNGVGSSSTGASGAGVNAGNVLNGSCCSDLRR